MKMTRHPGGRPTTYTPELAARICEEIVLGKSLRAICSQEDMPAVSTVFEWKANHQEFSEQYAMAKQEQADTLADDMEDIARDTKLDVQRARLIIDTMDGGYAGPARLPVLESIGELHTICFKSSIYHGNDKFPG